MSAPAPSALSQRLEPVLQRLEEQRLAEQRKCDTAAMWCLGIGGVWALLAIVIGIAMGGVQWWIFLPLAVLLVIYVSFTLSSRKEYRNSFKILVMPALVAQFGDLKFFAQNGISEAEFSTARLFERPDRFSSEDLIEGKIGATKVRFSEVHAERRETHRDAKGNTTTHYVTFFRGLFFIADFNKRFNGVTFVFPEGLAGLLGGFGESLKALDGKLTGRGELVKLEDPEFEQQFVVLSKDQIEARYLLSSSLMRRFLDLKALFRNDISAAFVGESLYLAIEIRGNWFEPPSLSQPLNFEALGEVLHQLECATGVVETLDLNTRIWTKD